jgi:hypothetical protein
MLAGSSMTRGGMRGLTKANLNLWSIPIPPLEIEIRP